MTVGGSARREPKSTLQSLEIRSVWSRQYRGGEDTGFYGLALDYIAGLFGAPTEDPVLDVGCGSGTKSLELAKRGYRALGIDFSTAILDLAKQEAGEAGLADHISFAQ